MREYKQDLLLEIFPRLYDDITLEDELEIEELNSVIMKHTMKLGKKQRLAFSMLYSCNYRQNAAYKIFCKRISKVDLKSFKSTMKRARKNIAKWVENEDIVIQLKEKIFNNKAVADNHEK